MKIEKQRYFDIVASVWEKNHVSCRFREEINGVLQKIWITSDGKGTEKDGVSLFQLPVLCADAVGGTARQVEYVAAAWSLLYSALFLLDKIEDHELEVLPIQLNASLLTNVTTGLLATVELILDDLKMAGGSTAAIAEIRAGFHRCLVTMCASQSLDLYQEPLSLTESWEVAAGKSGAFFALGCSVGVLAACGDPELARSFYNFGHTLGLLIQIEDDLDGLWGKPNKQSDIAQRKFSLPVAYAYSVVSTEQGAGLQNLLRNAKIDYNAEVAARTMVLKSGALLYLFLEAEKLKQTAASCLEGCGLEPTSRMKLLSLINRLDMQCYLGK